MSNNEIYYRFFSEKKPYSISFKTTEISIGDIRKEIEKRRNMAVDKKPEEFEFLYAESDNNGNITEEFRRRDNSDKIQPYQRLLIKRVPGYKFPQFKEVVFKEIITDPSELTLSKEQEFDYSFKKNMHSSGINEPLEKIIPKITIQMLKEKFKCKLCKKEEEYNSNNLNKISNNNLKYEYKPVITLCCYETICENCAKNSTENICPLCKMQKNGYIPNKSECELKDKLYELYNKYKEDELKMQLNQIQIQKNEQIQNLYNNQNNNIISNSNQMPINGSISNQNKPNNYNTNINFSQNPSFPLFEKAQFFIMKSSNRDNLEISQKNNEWATTLSNQVKLNSAFAKGNVILIFSVVKTGCYQGYAVMTTYIGDKVSNHWQNENNVKLGASFGVFWLCICEMPFNKIKALKNPKNDDLVTKSRDSTELTEEIGKFLTNLCYEHEKMDNKNNNNGDKTVSAETVQKLMGDIKKSREAYIQMQNAKNNYKNYNNYNNVTPNVSNNVNMLANNTNTNLSTSANTNNVNTNNVNNMVNNNGRPNFMYNPVLFNNLGGVNNLQNMNNNHPPQNILQHNPNYFVPLNMNMNNIYMMQNNYQAFLAHQNNNMNNVNNMNNMNNVNNVNNMNNNSNNNNQDNNMLEKKRERSKSR